ncbi:sigma-70 family RNA polymerase sigma factor [uncultured Ruegeria sp.]|uniref:sigma-70 family RNA polymerase sigma factor n=1 Tax=uncultured Ruegeria sp. TaxID=259304 RepID=UPI0026096606|nr:sigma-70 family RNA polymerase sigma factor [uncultured Ruegeria sp.]
MARDEDTPALEAFRAALPEMRGELHRYLARMTGSVIDGEDLLQDALLSAAIALQSGAEVQNLRAWLFRIAHNTALNFFRARKRETALRQDLINLPPALQSDPTNRLPEALKPYLALSPIQRSIVILRDVLGYSTAEVAELTDSSVAAVKSALHRGRTALIRARDQSEVISQPLTNRQAILLREYAKHFNAHDFDRVRDMLSAEVRLELVSVETREGKALVSGYFRNYAKQSDWQMVAGMLEYQPAILSFARDKLAKGPTYAILLDISDQCVAGIRDFRYARYVMQEANCSLL